MKKIITWILIMIFILVLAACGHTGDSVQPQQELSAGDATVEETSRPCIEKYCYGEPYNSYTYVLPDYEEASPTLEEQVLYDENGVRLTVLECNIEPDSFGYYSIPFVFENNIDRKLKLMTTSLAINKKMILGTTGGIYAIAEAESAVGAEMFFYQSGINSNAMRVSVPYEFSVVLTVYDYETGERLMTSEPIAFNAKLDFDYSEPKSLYRAFLYEDEKVHIRAGQIYENSRGNVELEVSVKNTSSQPLAVTAENVAVNGVEIETDFESWWVLPGCTYIRTIRFIGKDLESKGMSYEDISEISMQFVCRPYFEDEVLSESGVIYIDVD